jgi:hypothetical protein
MTAALSVASAGSPNVLTLHFWHGVEALAFLAITLGGIAAVEWRQRRGARPQRAARPSPRTQAHETAVRRTTLLRLAALSCAAAAGIHAIVMPEHFGESLLYGCFFLVTALAQFGYAAAILWRPSRSLLSVGLVANAVVVGLWLVTRLMAIPLGPAAGEREAFGSLDVLASSFEMLAVVFATVLVARGRNVLSLSVDYRAIPSTTNA